MRVIQMLLKCTNCGLEFEVFEDEYIFDEEDDDVTTFYYECPRCHKPVPGDTVMITAFGEVGV